VRAAIALADLQKPNAARYGEWIESHVYFVRNTKMSSDMKDQIVIGVRTDARQSVTSSRRSLTVGKEQNGVTQGFFGRFGVVFNVLAMLFGTPLRLKISMGWRRRSR
jgi:hypothetical protein